ncbi:MAG: M20 family metallopeptidase [Clostridia bacterium]|nr:M20 family metallopeptidase [Clostridia bacterium]
MQNILEQAEAMKEELVSIYRDRHMYPELSFKEFGTMDFIEKYLMELGLKVKRGTEGAGLTAVLKGGKPGKTVGIRADIDALPVGEETGLEHGSRYEGVMHACGHDSHITMLLGAAKLLCLNKENVRGKVKFMFQQAEEMVAGAARMISDGALDDIDEIIGLHVVPTLDAGSIETKSGSALASNDMFEIKVFGRGGHGSAPHTCTDPIIAVANIISAIQTISNKKIQALDPVVINICCVSAGTRYNIVPDEGYMSGTIRTQDKNVRQKVIEQLNEIADGVCKTFGTTYEFINPIAVPPTTNDEAITKKLIARTRDILPDNKIRMMDKPHMFSEDFACFGEIVPACMFFLGTYNKEKGCIHPLHSSHYQIDEDILPIGAAIFANYCMVE